MQNSFLGYSQSLDENDLANNIAHTKLHPAPKFKDTGFCKHESPLDF